MFGMQANLDIECGESQDKVKDRRVRKWATKRSSQNQKPTDERGLKSTENLHSKTTDLRLMVAQNLSAWSEIDDGICQARRAAGRSNAE